MQQELVLKAISHSSIGLLIIALFLVLLVALRKEIDGHTPFRGTVHIGLLIMGLCTFIALMIGHFQARRTIIPESVLHRIDTAARTEPGAARRLR